jgi:hypothetical protein
MRRTVFILRTGVLLSILSFSLISFSQTTIFTKSRKIINCNIIKEYPNKLKIHLDNDDAKKFSEIFKYDVILIQYPDSAINIISATNISELQWALQNSWKKDSVNFSIFYIVYNSGYVTERPFPIYFNSKLIMKLDNQSRIQCKIYSEGNLHVYRNYNGRIGPSDDLVIKNGHFYGIRITVDQLNIQTWDPNKQYSMKIINDTVELRKFVISEYYAFSPFKEVDYKMSEKRNEPIIIR